VRGRKPVPTALKIARGNPGQRRLRDEPAPAPAIDLTVPAILADDAGARAEWETTAPRLQRAGLLTEVDLDALTLYCATFARWKEAERQLQQHGLTLMAGRKKKAPIVSPYFSIAMKAQAQCRALLIEFGLTPVSRTRVHVPKPDSADAQRDRFFGLVALPNKRRA
jgi:P27 family predicted phage terminase small subunit